MIPRPLDTYTDIHTHTRERETAGDTVVCITPDDYMCSGGTYSIGIHPWSTAARMPSLSQLKKLVAMARDPRVVAIGEAGIDKLCGAPLPQQIELFRFHARLAERLGKPLVIHCVKAFDTLLAEAKALRPSPGMWIVHGFRGKPALARQLVNAGIALSLGSKFNPDILSAIPPQYIYRETDTEK